MKTFLKFSLLIVAMQTVVFAGSHESRRDAREKTEEISIQAVIESIDLETREVVL